MTISELFKEQPALLTTIFKNVADTIGLTLLEPDYCSRYLLTTQGNKELFSPNIYDDNYNVISIWSDNQVAIEQVVSSLLINQSKYKAYNDLLAKDYDLFITHENNQTESTNIKSDVSSKTINYISAYNSSDFEPTSSNDSEGTTLNLKNDNTKDIKSSGFNGNKTELIEKELRLRRNVLNEMIIDDFKRLYIQDLY